MTRRLLAFIAAVMLTLVANAQTVEVTGAVGVGASPGASVAVLGLREGDVSADLRFGVVVAPSGADAIVAAHWARSATLGLLGAVTLEVDTAFRSDGRGAARLSGQGVLGPAAVALVVSGRSADQGTLTIEGIDARSLAPRLATPVWGIESSVRYRIDRQLLLGVEPALFGSPDGLALRLESSLRVRRWIDDLDAVGASHLWLDPATGHLSAAVGAGVVWAPRRAPEWHATLWLGAADGAVQPGVSLRGRAEVDDSVTLDLELAAQPYRRDVPAYRAFGEATFDVGAAELFIRVQAELAATGTAPALGAATFGARFPLSGR